LRNNDLERAAETHFFIRPEIVKALERTILTDAAKKVVGDHDNYLSLWQGSLADRFFDMATMIRLGTSIETGLRYRHRQCGGVEKPGMYQRLKEPTQLLDAFRTDCTYDLSANAAWGIAREIMMHRHLYAHRSGLVDKAYIDSIRVVCGVDIEPELTTMGYPTNEVYWFKPLEKLGEFIEGARQFFRELG
jgi:hypothetical protein